MEDKKTSVELRVESVENPHSDYYIVRLGYKGDLNWKPGSFGIFSLPGKTVEEPSSRTFSLASIPEEGYILLGTRTGPAPSSFKSAFLSMQAGERVDMEGPMAVFDVKDQETPLVLFASGVGITPIRSLLRSLRDSRRRVEVVYAARDYYLFGDEIRKLAEDNPSICLYQTVEVEETRARLGRLAVEYGNSAYYYNSASPAVIQSTEADLLSRGISKERIFADSLYGLR